MAAEESVKRAVRSGDLAGLSRERFRELGIELDEGLGADQYSVLHWACHQGKAEVKKIIDTQCSQLADKARYEDWNVLNAGSAAYSGAGCRHSRPHPTGMDGCTHLRHQGVCYLPAGESVGRHMQFSLAMLTNLHH